MTPEDALEALRAWLAPKPKEDEKPEPARASIDQLKDGMEEIRGLLQRFGAAVGGAATVILTGVGLTQVHEIFPLPPDSAVWLTVLALAAGIAALVGAAWLAARFFAAQRRILMTTDQAPFGLRGWFAERQRGFGRRERDVRNYFFDLTAAENGAQTLHALELRGQRLERIAQRLPAESQERKAFAAEAERLTGVVRLGMAQGAIAVLERRSHQAFKGSLTALALLMTIFGLLTLFGLADWSKGHRQLITLRKECAEATKAGATAACEGVLSKDQREAVAVEASKSNATAKTEEDAALDAAQRTLSQPQKRAVVVAAACRVIVDAEKRLQGDGEDAKRTRQVALTRCVRAG